MSTQACFPRSEIGAKSPYFGKMRSIIETAFYGNNVVRVPNLRVAYDLAKSSPGTIVTDMPIFHGDNFGLPRDAKVLLFNDGSVTGRTASARRIAGEPGVDTADLDKKLLCAVYQSRFRTMYHAEVYIGLDPEFMVKAHLLIPEGFENNLYSWMLNFQYRSDEYIRMYKQSNVINDEGDIYIFADPEFRPEGFSNGMAYFDPKQNCAAITGMRYFGELKKGTLTLAWAIASRNGYVSCHGGLKRYNLADGKKFVASVFGLSGSGKSTITHNKHHDKYDVTILHDDAFIINAETGSSIAMEPTYFDKTADYPIYCEASKYLLTVQNCAATSDEDGNIVVVTEDIRNGNGRAIKSKLWSPNRVDKIEEPVNAIFWIMKDPTLPPIVKVRGGALAAVMGATLATKRSSAENLAKGVDMNMLVYEPYANPFRTYPLKYDYVKFKTLVDKRGADCYIINTGDFLGKKVTPADTLGVIEAIVEGKADFKQWGPFESMEIMEWEGFVPDMEDKEYLRQLQDAMKRRRRFISERYTYKDGFDQLPAEALESIEDVIRCLCDLVD